MPDGVRVPDSQVSPAHSAAWTDRELIAPHLRSDKPERVRRMFAAIAGSYDLNNRLHSLWQDQRWRRFAVRAAGLKGGEAVLDIACGTGDLTRAFVKARPAPASVVGMDFTPQMLDIARVKSRGESIRYVEADALRLPADNASADVLSIAFGIRNVADPAAALREFFRVLKPGGRLVILEFDRPRLPVLGWLANLYTTRIMPLTATLVSRDRSGAYRYLPKSVETFLDQQGLGNLIRETGFTGLAQHRLSLGICVCHVATKP